MSNFIRQCEEHLAKYHGHSSSFIMTMMVVAICGFIAPSLLYAAEVQSSVANPVPTLYEFNRERPDAKPTSTPNGMIPPGLAENRERPPMFNTSSQEKIIQYRNERLKKMISSLDQLIANAQSLRSELVAIQTTSTTSTKAINMGQIEKKINEMLNSYRKANFANELPKLKKEMKTELNKRVVIEKKEMLKKQVEVKKGPMPRQLPPTSTFPGNPQGLPAGSPPGNSEAQPQGNPLPPPMQQ